jgi:hypothetical protein
MAAFRGPSCFIFVLGWLSSCPFRCGDSLGLIQISFVDQEGFDYFVVQRGLFPDVIHNDLESDWTCLPGFCRWWRFDRSIAMS